MDREEIRCWESDVPSDGDSELGEDLWKTAYDEDEHDEVKLPNFDEAKAMYQELYTTMDEPRSVRLTGGFCYYLGVLDGPSASDLSRANRQRHMSYLTHRMNTAKVEYVRILKRNRIGIDELLRLYISCLHFGDTDPSRSEVARWYQTEDTIDLTRNINRYTPYERFVYHHSQYVEKIVNQLCPGVYYPLHMEKGKKDEQLVILQHDMRSAIQAILWKCIPETEKMSYRVHHID